RRNEILVLVFSGNCLVCRKVSPVINRIDARALEIFQGGHWDDGLPKHRLTDALPKMAFIQGIEGDNLAARHANLLMRRFASLRNSDSARRIATDAAT